MKSLESEIGYPDDLRWTDGIPPVRIISSAGIISEKNGISFESIPYKELNYYRLFRDEAKMKKANRSISGA
jgi:hypothetical protein